jgi:hypothetical protein
MQKLTSVIKEGKHGKIFEETIDSRFVFPCIGEHLLEPCKNEIDIPQSDVNSDGYACPVCGQWYHYSQETDTRGRRLICEDDRDCEVLEDEEDCDDADLSDTSNE